MNLSLKEERYLFTDYGFGLSHFKIYDSFETFNLITERIIREDSVTNWFNIDNIRREIEEYERLNPNIKLVGLIETLNSIHENGFSYTDKDFNETRSEIKNKRNIKMID
jgi:hypothetical protein